MRELTDHKSNGLNEALNIKVIDGPGLGGASHVYAIEWARMDGAHDGIAFQFQNGTIAEVGVNGVSQEALIAIVIDRLKSFQAGEFACEHNAEALGHLQGALKWMHARTRDRVRRGVEGSLQK